jgi:ribosomal protein S18 acetylase RimI-like enzyme
MTVSMINEHSNQIRKMDVGRDLDQIADLIEMSFPIQQDPDGLLYIQNLRKTARQMHLLDWLSPWTDMAEINASGFVWEDDGRIIGNLSLIPFQNEGRKTYLVANVAVHPTYRHRGIARALTRRALGYLRRSSTGEVWLQVREDNRDAQTLYRSVGFIDRAVRTTWRIRPMDTKALNANSSAINCLRNRKAADWSRQKHTLDSAYPPVLRWNYPLDFARLSPGFVQVASNIIDGIRLRHWTYDLGRRGQGQITWQKTDTFANNLWLAFNEAEETDLLPGALLGVFRHLSQEHPLSIDYPRGRSQDTFEALGFKDFRTLIWMSCSL